MKITNAQIAQRIKLAIEFLPKEILAKHLELKPVLAKRYGERERYHYLQDTEYNLRYLAESILLDEPVLFIEYMGWLRNFFDGIKVPSSDIIFFFEILEEKLSEYLNTAEYEKATGYLRLGLERFKDPKPQAGFIDNNNPLRSLANNYLALLLNAERREALNIIMDAYNNGVSIKDLYLHVFQPTQLEVGRLWQTNKISVAQEHFETAATQLIMSQLYPYLFNAVKKEKKVVVSCVSGELHEMGARMVADFFEMDGWDSYYLGANTPSESIIKTLEENNSKILALSVTMTYNLESAYRLIEIIKNNPGTKNVKVLVGGYPFLISNSLWQKVGADGFARNSDDAIRKADEILLAKI